MADENTRLLEQILEELRSGQSMTGSPNRDRYDETRARLNASETGAREAFTGTVNSLTGVFGKLASGTANAGDAFNLISFTMGKFGTVAGSVGEIFNTLGKGAINVNEMLKDTSRFGVTFGNDLGVANLAIKNAHLTLGEFADIISQNSQSMAGLGSTMDKSSKAYLSVLRDVETSEVGRDLRAAGMSARELAEITQLSISRRRNLDLLDDKSKEAAAESAARLASEFNFISEITGKNRKQLLEEQRRAMESTEVLAAGLQLGQKFRTDLNTATAELSPTIKRIVMEQATGGVRTEEGMTIAASLGPAMREVNALVEATRRGDQKEIAKAQADLELATMRQIENQSGATMLLGDNLYAHGKLLQENIGYIDAIRAKQEEVYNATKQRISDEDAYRALKEEGRLKREGKTAEGAIAEGAITGRAINQIEYLGKVAGSVGAEGLKQFNDKLGSTAKDAIPQFEIALKEFATGERAIRKAKEFGEDIVNKLSEVKTLPWTPPTEEKNIPKRQDGSLGSVGKLIEDFGKETLIKVHGKEGIITEQQLEKLMEVRSNGFMPGDILKLAGIGPSVIEPKTEQVKSSDLDSKLKELGVTGFGNTVSSSKKITSLEDVQKESAKSFYDSMVKPANQTKVNDPLAYLGKDMTSTLSNWQAGLSQQLAKPTQEEKPPQEAQQQPQQPVETQKPADTTTTSDVKEELVRLNTNIRELISHTDKVVEGITQQIRATKSLSGNLLV